MKKVMSKQGRSKLLESKYQKKILDFLKKIDGCYSVKTILSNKKGVPDILCCYWGKFYAFEVKTPDGKLLPHQKLQGELIRIAGGQWYVVTSVDDVKKALGVE